MFREKNNPSMNELVRWFQVNFSDLMLEMNGSFHNSVPDEPNPYHIENSVWAHSMMVCLQAEILEVGKVTKITALLHDIGKPKARMVIPFEQKKPIYSESNQIRNEGESGLSRVVPLSGLKTHFRSHEALSTFLVIPVLRKLEQEGVINQLEKIDILSIISLHGTLFDNMKDGREHKPEKVIRKFNSYELYKSFVDQVKCDSLGRFFISTDGRKEDGSFLGDTIYNMETFGEHFVPKTIDKTLPTITVLVGPPNVGKSTWIKVNKSDECVISRDDTLIRYAEFNGMAQDDYSTIWKNLTEEDQKEIDAEILNQFNRANKSKNDIIIDMTNMSKKSRRKWLSQVKGYNKKAVVFMTDIETLFERNLKRKETEGKYIPEEVIINMIKSFLVPTFDEVDEILWEFN